MMDKLMVLPPGKNSVGSLLSPVSHQFVWNLREQNYPQDFCYSDLLQVSYKVRRFRRRKWTDEQR